MSDKTTPFGSCETRIQTMKPPPARCRYPLGIAKAEETVWAVEQWMRKCCLGFLAVSAVYFISGMMFR